MFFDDCLEYICSDTIQNLKILLLKRNNILFYDLFVLTLHLGNGPQLFSFTIPLKKILLIFF